MTGFRPIAIVGQACVLPGAHSPEQLWSGVFAGRDLISRATEATWQVADKRRLMRTDAVAPAAEKIPTDRGGYVTGFEKVFDPAAHRLEREMVTGLDPLFQWLLHTGREAMHAAGVDTTQRVRGGAIIGNLSYPTYALNAVATAVWAEELLGKERVRAAGLASPDRLNRFMSGLPVNLLCESLQLTRGGFMVDAACASSLYAIKFACDWLASGRADVMLAGGVSRVHGLTIHAGFTTLQALSPSGRSRPLHAQADGLIPSEGAAVVVLKRLEDAQRDGSRILGVIRGVGLANDGRGSGLLVPFGGGASERDGSGVSRRGPAAEGHRFDRVPCDRHERGRCDGDPELRPGFCGGAPRRARLVEGKHRALAARGGCRGVDQSPEVDGARRAAGHPPSRRAEPGAGGNALGAGGRGDRVDDRIRATCGGERVWVWRQQCAPARGASVDGGGWPECAGSFVCRARCVARSCRWRRAWARARTCAIFGGRPSAMPGTTAKGGAGAMREIRLPIQGSAFPPKDLENALAQQTLTLEVAHQALAQVKTVPFERTAVFIGMGCDAEACRFGLNLRLEEFLADVRVGPVSAERDRDGAAGNHAGTGGGDHARPDAQRRGEPAQPTIWLRRARAAPCRRSNYRDCTGWSWRCRPCAPATSTRRWSGRSMSARNPCTRRRWTRCCRRPGAWCRTARAC
jgi:3-oxoacyl-(acyl-carrier-protein) synthase